MARCKATCLAVTVSLLCFHATPTLAVDFLKYKLWFYQWGENELHLETLETRPCAQAVRNYWNPNYPDPSSGPRAGRQLGVGFGAQPRRGSGARAAV